MKQTRIDRKKLLAVIKKNRETHLADYNEAIAEYRRTSQAYLEKALQERNNLPDDKLSNLIRVDLPLPLDMTVQYDEVISMLEYSADKIIELSTAEFQNYVLDKWAAAAKETTNFYKGMTI